MTIKAQIIKGDFDNVIARKKSNVEVNLGELLVYDGPPKIIFQVYDIFYSSQISDKNLEKISGLTLEDENDYTFFNEDQRNYLLLALKPLLTIRDDVETPKTLPPQFTKLRKLESEDLTFMQTGNDLTLGKVRNGREQVDVDAEVNQEDALSHHILISGTTGKGKSVLMKNLLWNSTNSRKTSNIVFDPHDEYYGRNQFGLKDHDGYVKYYTPKDVPPGGNSLVINIQNIKPHHLFFDTWSSAQRQAMYYFYKKHDQDWIDAIYDVESEDLREINDMTLMVLRRKLKLLLNLDHQDALYARGIFKQDKRGVKDDIITDAENGKTIIIDTSIFDEKKELLISSIITQEIFNKYKYFNEQGRLAEKPVINITLEEAPRVLGKDVLQNQSNIFSTIAREGRKFNVGLTAITQMPSLIPKQLLANMNTKIILGTEMKTERNALIESSSQDLSKDDRNIASLEIGEAIVTSSFTDFAIPLHIPYFEEDKQTTQYEVQGLK